MAPLEVDLKKTVRSFAVIGVPAYTVLGMVQNLHEVCQKVVLDKLFKESRLDENAAFSLPQTDVVHDRSHDKVK